MSEHGEGMAHRKKRVVLIADDEVSWFEMLAFYLRDYKVIHAATEGQCLSMLAKKRVDCVVLDWLFGDDGTVGFRLLREIRLRDRDIPVVVFTVSRDERVELEARNLGATEFVSKRADDHIRQMVDIIYRLCPKPSSLEEWELRLEDWIAEEQTLTLPTTKQLSRAYCKALRNRLNSQERVGDVLRINRKTVSRYLREWKQELEKERWSQ